MHISPYENNNRAIVDIENAIVPHNYFNIVKLKKGENFEDQISGYECCIVPATGTVDITVCGENFEAIGGRVKDVWGGEPECVYIPSSQKFIIRCMSDTCEIFIAGAKFEDVLEPFSVRSQDIDLVQYGSDETKTHRKIKHLLGQKQNNQVGRLLVSELFTVGSGGWSGFPSHKHDTDRLPYETKHDETYNFRFRPNHGCALQMLQLDRDKVGNAFHILNGSTFCISGGYHPVCALPGYEMYYFTILGGYSQRPLVQYFQPDHEYQVDLIPGIKDMINKFK